MIPTEMTVLISEEVKQRVQALATARGVSPSEVVQEVLAEYFDEMEDIAYAKRIAQRIASGQESIHSKDDVWAELDELSD